MSPSPFRLCASRSVAPAVGLAGDRVHARRLLLAGHGIDEHDAQRSAVLGPGEHAAALGLHQRLSRAHAQVVPVAWNSFSTAWPSKHASAAGGIARAQRVQLGVVVGVARREVEHDLGRDPEPGHARVVDGAAERVAARRSGQARAVSNSRGSEA
jgi:hypothetical protein